MAIAIKLALVLLAAVLLPYLRRSHHPAARKLLVDVDSWWDHTRMSHSQVKAYALRSSLFGLSVGSIALFSFVLSRDLTPGSATQVAAVFAGVCLVTLAVLSLLNAAHLVLVALRRRAEATSVHAHSALTSPLDPR